MKKTWLFAIAIFTVLIAISVYFDVHGVANPGVASSGTNVFTGRIVNGVMAPGSYDNVPILSDRGCTTDPRTGLSNCTTSFATKSGTIYYFNYEHNMMVQPCLSIRDKVNVHVSSGGVTTIERTYWGGGGGE